MDGIMIDDLEDEYTSGKCTELACALARKYTLNVSAFLFLEDDKGNVLTLENCNNLSDIPKEQHKNLFIDHSYASDGKNFYDFYGKTNNPQYMCEPKSVLINNLSEEDILSLTLLTKQELNERMKNAELEVIDKFPERFNIQNNQIKPRKNRP